jgi:sugar phosphate isomerase/epimerase
MAQQQRRKLSLSALTVLELSPPEMVECAIDAGYDHVGLRLLPASDTEVRHDIVGDTPLKRETLARLKDSPISVLDAEILRLKPDTDVNNYLPMLMTAAELGARYVLVAGNDPDDARLADRLGQLCELALPLGLSPSLEPMPWTDLRTMSQGAAIIAACGHTNTGLILDPLHFDRVGGEAESLRSLPSAYFGYMQFCDGPALRPTDTETLLYQARLARMIPGKGGLDLVGMLRAMPDHLPISIEVPDVEWAKTTNAVERATVLRHATEALVASAYA